MDLGSSELAEQVVFGRHLPIPGLAEPGERRNFDVEVGQWKYPTRRRVAAKNRQFRHRRRDRHRYGVDGNPFVRVPDAVLTEVFGAAGRDKSPIPIRGAINGRQYRQTLVRFRGDWRLYVNMQMLTDSPRRIGEVVEISAEFDPSDRSIEPHPKLVAMLERERAAREVFDSLVPSRRLEIVRYIDGLKSDERIDHNVERARQFLLGNGRFVGRDHP